jgi:hypothetical protein
VRVPLVGDGGIGGCPAGADGAGCAEERTEGGTEPEAAPGGALGAAPGEAVGFAAAGGALRAGGGAPERAVTATSEGEVGGAAGI